MTGRCLSLTFLLVASAGWARAQAPAPDLPKYDMRITLDTRAHVVHLTERVTWTNRHTRPSDELQFAVYPLYKIPSRQIPLMAKTVELLRQTPSESLMFEPSAVPPTAKLASDGRPLAVLERPDNVTTVIVILPEPVKHGESVTVELDYELQLPNKQGRWGHWNDVSFAANWHPTLCYYDDLGWQPTPFIPWHQPFFNEAGVYSSTIILPCDQVMAAPSAVVSERDRGDGWKEVTLEPAVLRDFALVASARFRVLEGNAGGVKVRVVHLPEHSHYAEVCLRVACDAIPVYSAWFGPYPYSQFTVAESYFPWNGNECAGMVWLDHRIFLMPKLAEGYVDYLLSHEICHQWWYNLIGTNGYAETFMDEGPATYFSHRYIDRKVGKNNEFLKFPNGLGWAPNIRRENYRFATWQGSVRRGEAGPAVQPIDQYAHVYDLFSGAYDRGSRIMGMIEERLGEAAFMDFIRTVVRKYSFRILRVADFQKELECYTGQSWEDFFQQWMYGRGLVDWKLQDVKSTRAADGGTQVEFVMRQTREIDEPTVVGFKLGSGDGYAIRVPVRPAAGAMHLDNPPADIEPIDEHLVRVRVQLPEEPTQISIDPDGALPDADPTNNHWRSTIHWRLTPLYTQIDDADLINDYDRWTVQAGPYIYAAASREPWYSRALLAGFRVGAVRTQQFAGGGFIAYRSDYNDFVYGADALFNNEPWPKTQVGFHFEKRIGAPLGAEGPNDVARGVVYTRYVFANTSATYLNPIHYVEAFGVYQDNALPYARFNAPGAVRPENSTTAGMHYSINLLTPYWDPEGGFRFDASYQIGSVELQESETTNRLDGQLTLVKTPPRWMGLLNYTKFAIRGAGAVGWPEQGMYYALGGSSLFRGFDLSERQGNMFWVVNMEWRVPIVQHLEWDVCDHLAGLRGVYLAPFYDVGAIYGNGQRVGNVAHAVGVGLRWDVAWCSFIERSIIRLDIAKTLNEASPVQVWVGFMHTF